MQKHEEKGFLKRLRESLHSFREGLQKDSVASNPSKPVDCCNPPTAKRAVSGRDHKLEQ